jgi:hypothetical protein
MLKVNPVKTQLHRNLIPKMGHKFLQQVLSCNFLVILRKLVLWLGWVFEEKLKAFSGPRAERGSSILLLKEIDIILNEQSCLQQGQ